MNACVRPSLLYDVNVYNATCTESRGAGVKSWSRGVTLNLLRKHT